MLTSADNVLQHSELVTHELNTRQPQPHMVSSKLRLCVKKRGIEERVEYVKKTKQTKK